MPPTDPRGKSDFGGNKGVNPQDNPQLKPGAKDSIGTESNKLVPFSAGASGVSGPYGGEKKGT
jgi:hypothetical protein